MDKTTLKARGTAAESSGYATTPALTILCHCSAERVGERARLDDLAAGKPVHLSRSEPGFAPIGQAGGAPLGDEHLSRRPLCLVRTDDGGVLLKLGDSGTRVAVKGRPVSTSSAFTPAEIQRGVVLELADRVVLLLHAVSSLQDILGAGDPPGQTGEITGASDALRRVLWEVASVADLDLPVLLRGETGSGKELVARAIHRQSSRRDKPFVAVNLGAVSPSLANAELFGAEKGSYTHSVKCQIGYFEQAEGGTLFLDEIGDAPAELQVALLRALETGEIQPVGGRVRKVDTRIIAATDADLDGKVRHGTFRAALLNRLATYEIWIPPLRERRDDIGRLLVRFLREELDAMGESHRLDPPPPEEKPWLPASLVARLADYDWPGNVRKLRNVVRQLIIGNRGRKRLEITAAVERLLSEHQSPESSPPGGASPAQPAAPDEIQAVLPVSMPPFRSEPAGPVSSEPRSVPRKPAGVTEQELREALRASGWELEATAQKLGISRASIYNLCERYHVRMAGDLAEEEIIRCHRECGGNPAAMAERLEVSERALRRRVRELGLE